MNSHNNIIVTPENLRFVFDWHTSKTIMPFSGFPTPVRRIHEALFSSLLSVFLFSNPVPMCPSPSGKFHRHSNRKGSSACRKQLNVRGVSKASLALILLTPLPLHPKYIQVWMYIFLFSAGGNGWGKFSIINKSPINGREGYVGYR